MCGKVGGRKNTPCFAYVPEPRKCLLVESGILGFEIRARGIRNPSNYWNQESKTFLDYLSLYGASLLRSAEAPRGMARVIVEIQKRILEPVRKGETRGATR